MGIVPGKSGIPWVSYLANQGFHGYCTWQIRDSMGIVPGKLGIPWVSYLANQGFHGYCTWQIRDSMGIVPGKSGIPWVSYPANQGFHGYRTRQIRHHLGILPGLKVYAMRFLNSSFLSMAYVRPYWTVGENPNFFVHSPGMIPVECLVRLV